MGQELVSESIRLTFDRKQAVFSGLIFSRGTSKEQQLTCIQKLSVKKILTAAFNLQPFEA